MGCSPTRLLCPWDSPGRNTEVGCHALLQGIFPTQGLNPGLQLWRQILYQLSHQGSPDPLMIHQIFIQLLLSSRLGTGCWWSYTNEPDRNFAFRKTHGLEQGTANFFHKEPDRLLLGLTDHMISAATVRFCC